MKNNIYVQLPFIWSLFLWQQCFCIDWDIGAPGHDTYLVDGLNACDKQYLKRYMKRINQPHEKDEDRNIKPYLIYITTISLTCWWMKIFFGKEYNSDQKVVSNTRNEGKWNNQAKTLSRDRSWGQNSPSQFDLTTYIIKPYQKNYMIHLKLHGH